MEIILKPGEKLKVSFQNTDGEFEIHFDTFQYINSFVIKETAGMSGNEVGEANSILYKKNF